MNYNILFFIIFIVFTGCKLETAKNNIVYDNNIYINKGFALVFSEDLIKNKITKKKIDSRSLDIHHSYLPKGTKVKITNLLNNKSIVGNVSKKVKNINFYNSIISLRISEELEINSDQPFIEIKEIKDNSIFLAKKTKIYDEEKNVANKAPVDSISINDLNSSNKKKKIVKNERKFLYLIKVVDFYFLENARNLRNRIINNTNIKKVNILSVSENIHRIILGPYKNINTLQKDFYSIRDLGFENINIISQ